MSEEKEIVEGWDLEEALVMPEYEDCIVGIVEQYSLTPK